MLLGRYVLHRGRDQYKANCDFLKESPLQVIQKARGRAESNIYCAGVRLGDEIKFRVIR
jgi:hypothetical protein